jgi:cysteine desulfurase
VGAGAVRRFSAAPTPFASTPVDKMARDARYRASGAVALPAGLVAGAAVAPEHRGDSIAGEALPGRAAYLDLQATTPLDPRVLDAMLPFYTSMYGNPHSRTHAYGWEAERVVEKARAQVAALIGADAKEVIFTSGATESNNMAIKGVARFYRSSKRTHVITTATEHKCVLDSCRWLEQEGFAVTYLPVEKSSGLVDLAKLEAAFRPGETVLVSVMGVNNEIGVVQPLREIGSLCRRFGAFFHTDAAQMAGKVPISVDECNIDLLSLSGHKIYGPKGVGALYVRRRPRVRLEALISGGGQERGLRSGTLPHPLIAGLGAACEIAAREMASDTAWVSHLSARLLEGIRARVPHTVLNGSEQARYPGNLNISFAYVEGESLLMALKNVAVSSGSACTSASLEPSYVLRAIGVDEEMAHTSIRFGLGRFTTEAEVDMAVDLCARHVARLREMSPLWEMVQEGIDLKTIQWSDAAH